MNIPFICSKIRTAHAYGVYISQMIRYSRACGSYHDFLDRWMLLTRKLLNQGFILVKLKSSLRQFYGRHWLGWPLWNICVTNDHGYVPLFVNIYRSFPHSRLITGFVTRLTRWVPLVDQELLTLPEHLSSPSVFSGFPVTRSLVLCVCFVDRCLSCYILFLLAIVLSDLFRYTDYDCPFGISKLFLQKSQNGLDTHQTWHQLMSTVKIFI